MESTIANILLPAGFGFVVVVVWSFFFLFLLVFKAGSCWAGGPSWPLTHYIARLFSNLGPSCLFPVGHFDK